MQRIHFPELWNGVSHAAPREEEIVTPVILRSVVQMNLAEKGCPNERSRLSSRLLQSDCGAFSLQLSADSGARLQLHPGCGAAAFSALKGAATAVHTVRVLCQALC